MTNALDTPWTDDRIARLKMLYAAEYSMGQIARDLGCSKSAVVGKCHRLNLPSRRSPIRRRPAPEPEAPPPPPPPPDKPYRHVCAWPMWRITERATHLYCGEPIEVRGYCARHTRLGLAKYEPQKAARRVG